MIVANTTGALGQTDDADRLGFVLPSKRGISTPLKQESKSLNSNKTDKSFSTRFSFNLHVALQKRAEDRVEDVSHNIAHH